MSRQTHANDNRSAARARRLLVRSWHRGTQESDLLLGLFADVSLAGLEDEQLDRYEALLDCADPDLFDPIIDRCSPTPNGSRRTFSMKISPACLGRAMSARSSERAADRPIYPE